MTETNEDAGLGHNNPPEDTPKTIPEILAEKSAETLGKIEPLAERANALPRVINTEEELNKVVPVVLDAKDLVKNLEAERKVEKDPHFKAGKEVDAFFNAHKERIGKIVTVFEGLASDFQQRKIEAERLARAKEAREAEEKARKELQKAEEAKRPETREKRMDLAEAAQADADRAAAAVQKTNAELGKVKGSGGTASARTTWSFSIEDFDKIDLNKIRHFIPRDAIEQGLRAFVKLQKGSASVEGVRFYEDVKTSFRR